MLIAPPCYPHHHIGAISSLLPCLLPSCASPTMPFLPLPPLLETSIRHSVNPQLKSAYNSVVEAERRAAGNDTDIMHARVVGYLMIALHDFRETLKDSAIERVSEVRLLLDAKPVTAVYELGLWYRTRLLRAFQKSKGPLSPSSQHSSRPSFTTPEDMLKDTLAGSGKDHRSAKRRALARDGFRCMLSGKFDGTSVEDLPILEPQAQTIGMVTTNCCQILSESTLQDVDPENPDRDDKREYAAAVLAVLDSLRLGAVVRDALKQNGAHHLSNVLTMSLQLHDLFDKFNLWLEGTGRPHEYKICVSNDAWLVDSGITTRTVRFRVHAEDVDEETLPLPDPALLALYATCARVVNMSGAAEYMHIYDSDADDMQVLAENGSSNGVLLEKMRSVAVTSREFSCQDSLYCVTSD
ncbi:hypothetical protein PsYK624_102000 [Phanerochaete sordida]|uniref:HNH nuclease domain-containing protein n=1 Tax=Phanerochaete sordida TaxID=48140 RepID=A0A9P3LHE0_9APHY|nr:hypothetical protein PsYK624_102000 [Phanerochaete sordida]